MYLFLSKMYLKKKKKNISIIFLCKNIRNTRQKRIQILYFYTIYNQGLISNFSMIAIGIKQLINRLIFSRKAPVLIRFGGTSHLL